jgi:hypothetical protein
VRNPTGASAHDDLDARDQQDRPDLVSLRAHAARCVLLIAFTTVARPATLAVTVGTSWTGIGGARAAAVVGVADRARTRSAYYLGICSVGVRQEDAQCEQDGTDRAR